MFSRPPQFRLATYLRPATAARTGRLLVCGYGLVLSVDPRTYAIGTFLSHTRACTELLWPPDNRVAFAPPPLISQIETSWLPLDTNGFCDGTSKG